MLVIVGLAGIIWFLPATILVYALLWLLGAAFYFINDRRLLPLSFSLILFASCLTVARLQLVANPILADFLIGISFALVINSSAGVSRRLPGNNWSRAAAGCSYSVYLCHFPFLVLAVSVLFHMGVIGYPGQATLKLACVFLMVLLLAFVWCYLISLATEKQTPRIRVWLNHWLACCPGCQSE
jgi:peptidoglycan/LPS O-acetylase OafA/YrhL